MPFLNGRKAVKVEGKPLMWGSTAKAQRYKIGETEYWIPKSVHAFCPYPRSQQPGIEYYKEDKMPAEPTGEIIIEEWWYLKNMNK